MNKIKLYHRNNNDSFNSNIYLPKSSNIGLGNFQSLKVFSNETQNIDFKSVSKLPSILTNLNDNETNLYHLLMNYRAQNGLPSIAISKCLTYVAKVHCVDQQISSPLGKCNLHSWSNLGPWTSCCYTKDHKKAKYMWIKPQELTPYKGYGFEIATYTSHIMTPEVAFELWKNSPAHNDLILNKGPWFGKNFKAIGVGMSKNYSNCWFGLEPDVHGKQ